LHCLVAAFTNQDREHYLHCLKSLREERLSAHELLENFDKAHASYGKLTMPETFYLMISAHLQTAVLQIVDPDTSFSESEILEKLETVEEYLRVLAAAAISIDSSSKSWLPLFNNTTHPIYTCQETALLFAAVAKLVKGSEMIQPKKGTTTCVGKIIEVAIFVNDLAENLSNIIKSRMGKSGWLDKILSMVQDELLDDVKQDDERAFENGSGKFSVATSITHVIGADGLESWAAQLLDSWRDSSECMLQVCKPTSPKETKRI
jgi:hypothetical protein